MKKSQIFILASILFMSVFTFGNAFSMEELDNPSQDSEISLGSGNIVDSGSLGDASDSQKTETDTDIPITQEEKEQVKKELNEYIIESYKAQGTKILKELDMKLQKSLPDANERIAAYRKIISSLELRKKRIEKMRAGQVKKFILKEFLDHMTLSLEKKIESLEK